MQIRFYNERSYTIKDMDWKRQLKLRDIRDTLYDYFKPCNFTLNALENFVLTRCKQEDKCEKIFQSVKEFNFDFQFCYFQTEF